PPKTFATYLRPLSRRLRFDFLILRHPATAPCSLSSAIALAIREQFAFVIHCNRGTLTFWFLRCPVTRGPPLSAFPYTPKSISPSPPRLCSHRRHQRPFVINGHRQIEAQKRPSLLIFQLSHS